MRTIRALKQTSLHAQKGAVSIFVVIFAILLMSVVTVSFLRIMVNDQSQASANDLAQSAYDSAQAGVEDAKRALLWYQKQCQSDPNSSTCQNLATQLASSTCNKAVVGVAGVATATTDGTKYGEVQVQSSASETGDKRDEALNQAYTCVTLTLDTDDYVGNAAVNQPVLVPLKSVAQANVDAIKIEWFTTEDLSNSTGSVSFPASGAAKPLLDQASWTHDMPSLLRAQYIQVGSNFKLSDFDYYNSSSSQSNTNTLFLYPKSSGGNSTGSFLSDIRKESSGSYQPASTGTAPYPTNCSTTVSADVYACAVTLSVPKPINGGTASDAYLLLMPFYNSTHFKITLVHNGDPNPVKFKAVQPIADSTGRAGTLFRRVQSHIDLYQTNPFIVGAVDVTGNFCKDFSVTDTAYYAGSCTP